MGNPILLQACLRLPEKEVPSILEVGNRHSFFKDGHRLYQIKVPMDLRTDDWKFIARIIITKYELGHNQTKGEYVIVKTFSEKEKEIITKAYVSDEEVKEALEKTI